MTWQTYLISFTVHFCILFPLVCIELLSLIWVLQIWVAFLCLWHYDQLVLFNKEINANKYCHSLWEYSKRFHCSFEWHLTPHMTLSIETCISGHPVLSRHFSIPQGCPSNTGFTVFGLYCYFSSFDLFSKFWRDLGIFLEFEPVWTGLGWFVEA